MIIMQDVGQRKFTVMGDNIFQIVLKLAKDQDLCRLLYYTDRTPLSKEKEDVKGMELLHKNILMVPNMPDDSLLKDNFVVVIFENFDVDDDNNDFKISTIRFDVLCPFDEWLIEESSLRPYLIMTEIDKLFNGLPLKGIGNLKFDRAEMLVVSPQVGGYTMWYSVHEFN